MVCPLGWAGKHYAQHILWCLNTGDYYFIKAGNDLVSLGLAGCK
jgi:hypothetical protein